MGVGTPLVRHLSPAANRRRSRSWPPCLDSLLLGLHSDSNPALPVGSDFVPSRKDVIMPEDHLSGHGGSAAHANGLRSRRAGARRVRIPSARLGPCLLRRSRGRASSNALRSGSYEVKEIGFQLSKARLLHRTWFGRVQHRVRGTIAKENPVEKRRCPGDVRSPGLRTVESNRA